MFSAYLVARPPEKMEEDSPFEDRFALTAICALSRLSKSPSRGLAFAPYAVLRGWLERLSERYVTGDLPNRILEAGEVPLDYELEPMDKQSLVKRLAVIIPNVVDVESHYHKQASRDKVLFELLLKLWLHEGYDPAPEPVFFASTSILYCLSYMRFSEPDEFGNNHPRPDIMCQKYPDQGKPFVEQALIRLRKVLEDKVLDITHIFLHTSLALNMMPRNATPSEDYIPLLLRAINKNLPKLDEAMEPALKTMMQMVIQVLSAYVETPERALPVIILALKHRLVSTVCKPMKGGRIS